MKVLKIVLGVIYVVLIILLFIYMCCPSKDVEEEYDGNIMVVDAETRVPLAGAEVFLETTDPEIPTETLVTNRSGRCTFTVYDLDETLTSATGRKEGYHDSTLTNIPLNVFESDDYTLVIPLRRDVPPIPPDTIIQRDTIIQHDTIVVNPPVQDPPRQDPPQQNPPVRDDGARQIGHMGALKVTLQYSNPQVDIDLHVIQPNGTEINYTHLRDNRTGGTMDIDWLPGKRMPIAENIYWERPPSGNYQVYLMYFSPTGGPAVNCKVTVIQENRSDRIFNVRLNRKGERRNIVTVNVP